LVYWHATSMPTTLSSRRTILGLLRSEPTSTDAGRKPTCQANDEGNSPPSGAPIRETRPLVCIDHASHASRRRMQERSHRTSPPPS
jgi:hypothetical protein